MSGLTIALAQINPCVGDIAGNAALVRASVQRAADAGAGLVAFPEMVITGYPIEDLALRESFQRAAEGAVQDLAASLEADGLGSVTVILGTLGVSRQGMPFNQAVVIRHGRVEAPVAYVNMWGGQDDLVFDGHSFIVGADGRVVASSPGFADDLLLWTLPHLSLIHI